jgi:gamma-glutamylcyclotransferase (GGCT)/AIG2-like uncharacterized protein YtfP
VPVSCVILFVHGTLKRGGRAHARLAGAEFLGEARTLPHYRVYDLGCYPGLVRDDVNGLSVAGELWRVPDAMLPGLDEYEGAPELFARGPIDLEGWPAGAVAYFYQGSQPADDG